MSRNCLIVYYFFFMVVLVSAALNMLHIHGGFLTNHLADIFVPAFLYVNIRGSSKLRNSTFLPLRLLAGTPERTAIILFLASTATEISQYFWPKGWCSGTFDVIDIAAFAIGVGICYIWEILEQKFSHKLPVIFGTNDHDNNEI